MRAIDRWLGLYADSHRNPVNKRIHWICVPLIVWTAVALLYAIPAPVSGLWACLAGLLACTYYLTLSPRLAGGLALGFLGLMLITGALHAQMGAKALALAAISIFVLAWIGQFIGHHIERKKPSFFDDLAFLLIGPAWLMAFAYRRLGLKY